ncbi:MAG: hypothetical protein HYV09_05785 [Deltaproteobacteria bacterium]|nr:hypothetical protein [Deltaproteobacteria bacterium]
MRASLQRLLLAGSAMVTALVAVSSADAAINFHSGPTVSVEGNEICYAFNASGLGNIDVNVAVTATFGATTTCRNKGGNVAPGQGVVTLTRSFPTETFHPKNGRVNVDECTVAPRGSDFPTPTSQQAGCPNGNWTVDPIRTSAIFLRNYSVTITYDTNPDTTLFSCTSPTQGAACQ